MDKRGQGLSTNAIILIVLGVVILVVLILGFTMGWEKLAPWMSKDNVDTIVNQCAVACSTHSVYDYCTKTRELKADGEKIKETCNSFATNKSYEKYGVANCSALQPCT